MNTPNSQQARNEEIIMSRTTEAKNKALLLDAFDTSLNKRDYSAAEKDNVQKA
jgi:hypothetical protein